MKTRAMCVILALAAAACRDVPAPTASVTPSLAVTDGAHNSGNSHFYWLPPMVAAPNPTGIFDPSSSPVVRISEWAGGEGALIAEFSMSTGPGSETVRLDLEGEKYIVNWHTGRFALDPRINYRIRVLVGGVELGFADVDVVSSGKELKTVDAANYVALLNGRTLPIKFRIEVGAVVVGAHLTLVKHVVNDNGQTAVAADFTLSASGPTSISGAGGVASGPGFLAGTYTLSETGPAGYGASAWTCTGGTLAGSQITLAPAEAAVCEITNDDVAPTARLTLVKHVVNDNGRTAVAADFTLSASGPTPISGAGGVTSGPGFLAGTYTLGETGPAGYSASAWTCTGGTQAGSQITLAPAETAVCEITNDDDAPTAHLTLVKRVVNDNGRTAVAADFTLSASGPTPISGAGGVASGPGFLAGTYTLGESGPAGYSASAWTCTGGTLVGSQITLAEGDAAVCEITNDDVEPTSVRLVSDAGDYIGAGKTYEYTQANAVITVTASGGHLSIGIRGDERWTGDFQVPNTLSRLEPGSYTGLRRYPFHDPAVGGLDWSGEGRGCNMLLGSFTVDRVTYVGNTLTAIVLRFEQHCEGMTPALRGEIHWSAGDPTLPPDPIYPVPSGLWQPAAGSTPATGNYVYLVSDPGDFIGQGLTYTYTPGTATITVSVVDGHLTVTVSDGQLWTGNFQTMYTLSQLEPGYYPDLRRYPFHNPAKGGLSWSGHGRACNTLRGWFAVDRVTYTNGILTALDLRFEQRCEGGTPALHGAIHWDR